METISKFCKSLGFKQVVIVDVMEEDGPDFIQFHFPDEMKKRE